MYFLSYIHLYTSLFYTQFFLNKVYDVVQSLISNVSSPNTADTYHPSLEKTSVKKLIEENSLSPG